MKKYYLNIFVLLVSLTFLTVFIKNDEIISSFTAKSFYFQFISIFIFSVVVVWFFFSKKKVKISLNKLDVLLLLFYIYNFIRLVFTESVPIYNDKFIVITLLVGYYFLFKTVLKNRTSNNYSSVILISVFLFVAFLQSLLGLFQAHQLFGFYASGHYAVGSFYNPSPYSGFVVSVLPFAFGFYMLIENKILTNKILKYLSLFTFCIGVLVLPLTKIRGDWLAILGGVSVIMFYKYNLKSRFNAIKSKSKKTVIIVTATALLVLLVVELYNIRPASAFGRLLIWKVSANIIADYPIFGAGFDRYSDIYNNYQAEYFAEEERAPFEIYVSDNVNYAHNDFIEVFTELGLVGFLFVIILFYTVMFKTHCNNCKSIHNNKLIYVAKASIVALAISSFFAFPTQILPTMLNIVFILSIISAFYKKKAIILIPMNNGKIKAIGLITTILISIFAFNSLNSYEANKNWKRAKTLSKFRKYDEAIKLYSNSYNELKTNGRFLLNYGGTLALANRDKEAIEILNKAKLRNSSNNLYIILGNSYTNIGKFNEAEEAYKKGSNIIPNRLYPKYMLAKSYIKANKIDKAKILATQIIKTDAKVNSTATKQIKNEMRKLLKELGAWPSKKLNIN